MGTDELLLSNGVNNRLAGAGATRRAIAGPVNKIIQSGGNSDLMVTLEGADYTKFGGSDVFFLPAGDGEADGDAPVTYLMIRLVIRTIAAAGAVGVASINEQRMVLVKYVSLCLERIINSQSHARPRTGTGS